MNSNKVRIAIRRSINEQPKENKQLWGVKLTLTGVYSNELNWKSNKHLFIFNLYIQFLSNIHNIAFNSTKKTDAENDFEFIMNEKFIQGIKLDDIQKYEDRIQLKCHEKYLEEFQEE